MREIMDVTPWMWYKPLRDVSSIMDVGPWRLHKPRLRCLMLLGTKKTPQRGGNLQLKAEALHDNPKQLKCSIVIAGESSLTMGAKPAKRCKTTSLGQHRVVQNMERRCFLMMDLLRRIAWREHRRATLLGGSLNIHCSRLGASCSSIPVR